MRTLAKNCGKFFLINSVFPPAVVCRLSTVCLDQKSTVSDLDASEDTNKPALAACLMRLTSS